MKAIGLILLLTLTSCTTNKALRNSKLGTLTPSSVASINLSGFQTLR
ncbi:conserved hypothetical protein [Halobacteriovorax marinus SJ]|uniref:Lipoprotein n=1 Tax=Halobacteriovorax marinus (strain ATCC BAA-682 / DSM 15412 / SJ) TaxID=862908 RepID=E1WZQ4_HALMS|nr:hypothetical protein [Halobacteriovorax marinus]CBW26240.1 conserved hypothetical protein [Halobacteriovorax marinus SJ]